MKINEFIKESTTSGAIATVSSPMTTQKRSSVGKGVYSGEKTGNLLTGKPTNKKYANSISESKMKQVAVDLETMQDGNFKQKYGKSKEKMMSLLGTPSNMKPKSANEVNEAHLEEDDLILVPGQGHKLKTGFHAFDPDKAEHEGETLKNSLRTIARNAKELHSRLENHDQFPEWVSEKIGTIKGMMTAVTEYLISKQEPAEGAGVIAGGAGNFEEAADPIAKRITVKKWGGDDMYSWAVLVDGRPAVTGLSKREVPYYKNMILKKLQAKPQLTGTNIEEGKSR